MLRRPKADRHDSFERTVPIRESVDWPMTKEFAFGSSIIDEGMAVKVKRVYAKPVKADGLRILVDRLWPRGLSTDAAMVDEWLRDLAPSDELRHWFHAYPAAWATFRKRYMKELARPEANAALETLYALARKRTGVTLLYASRNEVHNNATALKELIDGSRKPPTGTGPAASRGLQRARAGKRK